MSVCPECKSKDFKVFEYVGNFGKQMAMICKCGFEYLTKRPKNASVGTTLKKNKEGDA